MRNYILPLIFALLLTACTWPGGQQSAGQPATVPAAIPTAELLLPATTPEAIALPTVETRTNSPAAILVPSNTPFAPSPTTAAAAAGQSLRPSPNVGEGGQGGEGKADELAALDAIVRIPRDQVELARALAGQPDAREVARTDPLDVQVGDVQAFWVTSTSNDRTYAITTELRYAGPVVLMYVEQGLAVEQAALEQAAQTFEQRIYPRTRALFGSEWQPGVDGDPRITIVNGRSTGGGVAGYFSSRDSVPRSVNRFSNEREMFFMNIESVNPASPAYLNTLAHEFQHMIHWNEQRASAIWFNEGCSTLSEDLNGFVNHGFALAYLMDPDLQLTAWSEVPGQSIPHYGASNLFMRYIYTHYAGEQGLATLVRANAGNDLDVFVQLAATSRPDITSFGALFADWAVANLLNDPQVAAGRYTYDTGNGEPGLLPATVTPQPLDAGMVRDTVQQFGADYHQLPSGPLSIDFTGSVTVSLVGEQPRDRYAWWSGRGDDSVSTLTHALDLSDLDTATLRFDTWYELEKNYDYAFVSVSTDGGVTWQTLRGTHTTDEDPHGANYGNGLNGVSGAPDVKTGDGIRGRWVEERMDLTPYVGQNVLLRFWQISDDAFNAPGLLLDNVSICSSDAAEPCAFEDDVEAGGGDWQAQGFVRIDGDLQQNWELRLVRTDASGNISVEPLPTDAQGRASATLAADERAVLMVAATTAHTTEPASYQIVTR